MVFIKNKKGAFLIGGLAGILNGMFGSGGGVAAVPLLKKNGLSQKEAQATSLFMMLILSAVSAGIYLYEGRLLFSDAATFIPGGILGGICSAAVFKKIKPKYLKKIFGGIVTFFASKILWGILFEWIF